VLVLRPGALGDTLLAVPALRALRRRFQEPLTLAAHGETARLLETLGEVDAGVAFDDARLSWLFRSDAAKPTAERIVAWLEPAGMPGLRDALVVAPARPPAMDVHCARYLLDALDCAAELDDRPLRVGAPATEEVLIHPGSGSAAKNWPADRFASVINILGHEQVRLIVGEADASAAALVERYLGQPVRRLECLALAELATRLAGCQAYLGNDSGVSHLAGLCGARTFALFGPSSPSVWRPLGPRVRVLDFEVPPQLVADEIRMAL
jgi:heptosyltransferase III